MPPVMPPFDIFIFENRGAVWGAVWLRDFVIITHFWRKVGSILCFTRASFSYGIRIFLMFHGLQKWGKKKEPYF